MSTALDVIDAGPEHAEAVVDIIHRSFGARPTLDPPSTALDETVESIAEVLAGPGGLLVERRGEPMGALALRRVAARPARPAPGQRRPRPAVAWRRVGHGRRRRGHGRGARQGRHLAARPRGAARHGAVLVASPLPPAAPRRARSSSSARRCGSRARCRRPRRCTTSRAGRPSSSVPATCSCSPATSAPARPRSRRDSARPCGSAGPVTSPTFVLARTHPSLVDGPALVHVDAYRLGSAEEVDDLDLDASADRVGHRRRVGCRRGGAAQRQLAVGDHRGARRPPDRPAGHRDRRRRAIRTATTTSRASSPSSPTARAGPASPPLDPSLVGSRHAPARVRHGDTGRSPSPCTTGPTSWPRRRGRGRWPTASCSHPPSMPRWPTPAPPCRTSPTSPSASVPARSRACGSASSPP